MLIASLNPDQIIALHAKERSCGRILAPFEVQSILGAPTIKETFSIPEDDSAQSQHAARVRTELLAKKVATDVQFTDGEGRVERVLKPWEAITETNPERVHEYDFKVQAAAEDGKILFAYEGGLSGGGSKLRDRAKSRVVA